MSPCDSNRIIAILAGGLCLLLGGNLSAVQVYETSGSDATYTTAPSDNFGFQNVAVVRDTFDGLDTGGVYLGNGWILSAYHEVRSDNNGTGGFLFGYVILDGTSYTVNAATATRITDPTTHAVVDLAIYQLTTTPADPNLKTFVVPSTAPGQGSALKMMGDGINPAMGGGSNPIASLTYWHVNTNTNPWTWTGTTEGASNASGYYYGAGQSLRWGNGAVTNTESGDDGFGVTSLFYSSFQSTNGSAMGAGGDSGGGVFYKSGSTWELIGILLTIGNTYSGQPGNTSVVGNTTFGAILPPYRSQINTIAFTPVITTVQGSQTVTAGQPATFSISASGAGSFTYQWYKNNIAISGATGSSDTIAHTSSGDAANYTVEVTDPYGSTTSSAYTLVVNAAVPAMPRLALAVLALLFFLAGIRFLRVQGTRRRDA